MSQSTPSFVFSKGEDAQINWTIWTSHVKTTAQNVSGWNFALKVKRNDADADPSVITPTMTITTAASGLVSAVFAAAAMDALAGDYVYSFWRTDTGAKTCLARGYFTVIDSTQS